MQIIPSNEEYEHRKKLRSPLIYDCEGSYNKAIEELERMADELRSEYEKVLETAPNLYSVGAKTIDKAFSAEGYINSALYLREKN